MVINGFDQHTYRSISAVICYSSEEKLTLPEISCQVGIPAQAQHTSICLKQLLRLKPDYLTVVPTER